MHLHSGTVNFMRYKSTVIVLILLLSLFASSCVSNPDITGRGTSQPDGEHDFSVYLSGIGDAIRLNRIIDEYERNTGLNIEVITPSDGTGTNRALRRMLNLQNPPAVFTVDADTDLDFIAESGIVTIGTPASLSEIESATPIRFVAKGFAADKRVLSQLIGQGDTEKLISDIKLADYHEWSTFITRLGQYISDGLVSGFTLNDHNYSFANEKGDLVTGLTGVFAQAGADLSFLGSELLARTTCTTEPSGWEAAWTSPETGAGDGATGETEDDAPARVITLQRGLIDAYSLALSDITGNIAGLYAPGVRGDDFIDDEYYSKAEEARIFAAGRAVFTNVSTEDFESMKEASPDQAQSLALFPVKIPYLECGLDPVAGGVAANSAVPVRVALSLCINETLPEKEQVQAQNFVSWFVTAENYGGNPLMRDAAGYYKRDAILPYDVADSEAEDRLTEFIDAISGRDGLPAFLSMQEWNAVTLAELSTYLKNAWSSL
jgi:hypothetical protein